MTRVAYDIDEIVLLAYVAAETPEALTIEELVAVDLFQTLMNRPTHATQH